ncbi:ATP-binding protein [candidate division KSB1 bacterium]|nr:ATP-binding protein [candidate division KSB1 bacterium]
MSDHVVNIQKIGQHNDIIKISIDKGVEVTDAMPFLVQLLDNCFKNGMYKVIFDMERIKFPSPSLIAFLIEITAQTRRMGGNVILIRLPYSAINNFATFSPLNYLASEESDEEAIEELEILTPKSKKLPESEVPMIVNEILKPEVEEEPPLDITVPAEEEIEVNAEENEPPKEAEIEKEEPISKENTAVTPQIEEPPPEKVEKLTVEQNIFRLKEPQLPVKEIISEVAAGEKLPTERQLAGQTNIPTDVTKSDAPAKIEQPMSREEVQKIIAELRKQIEQQPADINFSDLKALQEKSIQEKNLAKKTEPTISESSASINAITEAEVNIPAQSILHQPKKQKGDHKILQQTEKEPPLESSPTTNDLINTKKPITPKQDKNIADKSDTNLVANNATNKIEIKEEIDPGKPKAFRIRVKSQVESLYKICDFVINLAGQAGIPEKELGKIKVTVYEASLNVIEHAYHSDADEWIVVTVQVDSQRFITIIQDWGESFNFDDSKKYDVNKAVQDRKTGGFGLFIIQRSMDQVQYKTDPLNGNRLILIKNLDQFKKPL